MIDQRFVFLGALLTLAGSVRYAVRTWRGQSSPNRVTWFFWAAAPLIAFFAQLDDGVGLPAVMSLSVGLGPAIIVVASFADAAAYWRLTAFDVGCGVVSAVAIVLWQSLDNPTLAVVLAVLADLVAGLPTFGKAWRAPRTEHSFVYLAAGLNGAITLLTIDDWSPASWAFPVYVVLLGAVAYALVRFELGTRLRAP